MLQKNEKNPDRRHGPSSPVQLSFQLSFQPFFLRRFVDVLTPRSHVCGRSVETATEAAPPSRLPPPRPHPGRDPRITVGSDNAGRERATSNKWVAPRRTAGRRVKTHEPYGTYSAYQATPTRDVRKRPFAVTNATRASGERTRKRERKQGKKRKESKKRNVIGKEGK